MIKLHGFGPAFNLPDPSPFVTKVELMLKVAGIDYERCDEPNNLQVAPKAKLPFIDDNGTIVSDSVFIYEYLQKQYDLNFDGWLSAEQRASAQLINKSLDENLYWVLVHSRWIKDDVWPTIKERFFGPIPFPLNHIIAAMARSSTRKQVQGHGIGKHSDEEILKIAHNSWHSLSVLLGDKPFFFGDKVSSLDITAFAMLSGFSLNDLPVPINKEIKKYPNLVSFTHRLAKEFYNEEITILD